MELKFNDFALTLDAGAIEVPYGIRDEPLFLTVRSHVLELLTCKNTRIFSFGYAPDNTADGQDELLVTGTYYRIIGYEKNLGIEVDSTPKEILQAFYYLVSNYQPFWTSILVDAGETRKETIIELLYQDVFCSV